MNENMNQTRKVGPLGAFLIGLFSGGGIAACVTGWFVKKKCDAEKQEAVIEAQNKAVEATGKQFAKNLEALAAENNTEVILDGPQIDKISANAVDTLMKQAITRMPYVTDVTHIQEPGEDVLEWEVAIDDKEATEEALERTMEHDRYLQLQEKYRNDPSLAPRRISEDEFAEEHYREKVNVSWYEDGVFAYDQEGDNIRFLVSCRKNEGSISGLMTFLDTHSTAWIKISELEMFNDGL